MLQDEEEADGGEDVPNGVPQGKKLRSDDPNFKSAEQLRYVHGQAIGTGEQQRVVAAAGGFYG